MNGTMAREFTADVIAAPTTGVAPPNGRTPRPAIERADELRRLEDDQWDPTRPPPREEWASVDDDDCRWSASVGWHFARSNEGATFVRLSEDVFVIPVRGAQPLHHDRHLAEIPDEQAAGFSEHTWNLVVLGGEGTDASSLMLEVGDQTFRSYPLTPGAFIYFDTVNRHAVAPRDPGDLMVIVQVDGYGPDEGELAQARLRQVMAARPDPVRV